MWRFVVVASALILGGMCGCSKQQPLYCDEDTQCQRGYPACDLSGACPASEFVANTCIPAAEICWDAGGAPDANQTDAMPTDALPPTVKQVSLGWEHSCALLSNGDVRCWGSASHGQLGYGNTNDIGDDEPASSAGPVPLSGPATQIAAGYFHTCAILQGGLVQCWGRNDSGQLGLGHTDSIGDDETATSAGTVDLGDTATQIAAGESHTCAVLQSGNVRCWGKNLNGELGYGNMIDVGDDEVPRTTGVVDVGGVAVNHLSAGRLFTCVSTMFNSYCFGWNNDGRLGYGHTMNIGDDEPPASQLGGHETRFTSFGTGANHACGLSQTGSAYCWGWNIVGALGHPGNTEFAIGDDESPLSVGAVDVGLVVDEIDAGANRTCIRSGTRVRCWGGSFLGYGNGDVVGDDETPASAGDIPIGTDVASIGVGNLHTCVVTTSGNVRCWGEGAHGKLGYGNTDNIGDNETPGSVGDVPLLP